MATYSDSDICSDISDLRVSSRDTERRPRGSNSSRRPGRTWPRGKSRIADFSYVGESRTSLPSCTSKWDIVSLESVGVFYDDHPRPISEILNMVFENTRMFGPLTDEQKLFVTDLQDSITFCYSIADVIDFTYLRGASSTDIIEETKKDLVKSLHSRHTSKVEDFIKSTVVMVQLMRGRPPVPKAVFEDLFKTFVKLCGLIPCPGSAWKSKFNILQQTIKSISDVVITSGDLIDVGSIEAASVVSIVEVKNLASYVGDESRCLKHRRTRPQRSSSNTDSTSTSECNAERDVHERPDIFHAIGEKVLGQHGGELLVHYNTYGEKFKKKGQFSYHPGMIVIGTQVTFTLLVCSFDHVKEFKQRKVSEKCKSVIHYSEPKDLLKKEDRNLLLESFIRLNNTDKYQPNDK